MKKYAVVICFVLIVLLALGSVFIIDAIKKELYPREYEEYVSRYSEEFSVPEPLIYGVILAESGFDREAISSAGAVGLMQIMPETFEWLSKLRKENITNNNLSDPETNIKYGTYYLSYLYERFENWETALSAYNAGHGRVDNWLKDSRYSEDGITLKSIPLEETNNYVNKVTSNKKEYEKLYYNDGE